MTKSDLIEKLAWLEGINLTAAELAVNVTGRSNMIINDLEIANAQARAECTRNEILQAFPHDLLAREEQLAATFKALGGNPLVNLEGLYAFMNEVYQIVNKFTPCKKGCHYCCFYEISISELEIQFIEKHGIKRSMNVLTASPHGAACPFLDRNRCSIYKHRPFVCRQHIMLDDSPKWCHPRVCNDIRLAMFSFSEINKVYENLMTESGLQRRHDIREIFAQRGKGGKRR